MPEDEIMARLRAARRDFAAKHRFDLRLMFEDLVRTEQERGWNVVSYEETEGGDDELLASSR